MCSVLLIHLIECVFSIKAKHVTNNVHRVTTVLNAKNGAGATNVTGELTKTNVFNSSFQTLHFFRFKVTQSRENASNLAKKSSLFQ